MNLHLLGGRIKKLRLEKKMTQEALCQGGNQKVICIKTLQRIECGKVAARITTLSFIVKQLDISLEELIHINSQDVLK